MNSLPTPASLLAPRPLASLLAFGLFGFFGLTAAVDDTNEIPGISGMAPIDDSSYLIVQDTKAHKKGRRVGILEVLGDGTNSYTALKVAELDKGDQRASDLEGLHAIGGRPGEYVAIESGRRSLGKGRLFHLELDAGGSGLAVLGSWPLAERVENPMDWDLGDGDNYEGIACWMLDMDRVQLVLGERGGSDSHARGALITGVLDLGAKSLKWLPAEFDVTPIAPGKWIDPEGQRDIADLWYDKRSNSIWCAASEDPGDIGPFRSVLWEVATVGELNPQTQLLDLHVVKDRLPAYVVDGHKIEAISAAPASVPHAFLSFGAEDEDYGGTWRPLYPPVK
jgi:hypothetical protein